MDSLNERAWRVAEQALAQADELRIRVHHSGTGARIVDCGIAVPGGWAAGLVLARVCLADLAQVHLYVDRLQDRLLPWVQVATDWPVEACMASQYAGWQIQVGTYFAMGSGPMRALARREPLFERLHWQERSDCAVGVLETGKLPDDAVIAYLCERLQVPASRLLVLAAPTRSIAGMMQVVARSVETALHKLLELGFDLARVRSALGRAPVPPSAKDDFQAIGRSNDAILYGAEVILYTDAAEETIEQLGPKVPAAVSRDFGQPFAEILARYHGDFYRIDPLLFSPAQVQFVHSTSGRSWLFGRREWTVLAHSFFGSERGP
ncbi:MAG: methenyltetrahydromethanopterin cyclohydrolase [Gemmataceae bacterium]